MLRSTRPAALSAGAANRLNRAVIETLEKRVLLTGDGLQATYYAGPNFTGSSTSRLDPAINFNWKHTTPVKGISANQMSVTWTGQIVPPVSAKYTFYITSQGGATLSLDGQVLINAWKNHRTRTNAKTIALTGGQSYNIELDYQGGKFAPIISMAWYYKAKGQKRQIIPTPQLYSGTASAASNLAATQVSGSQVNLAWQDNSDNETGFQIQRSVDGVTFDTIATVPPNTTTFSDTAVPAGRHVIYDVLAIDPSGISAPSTPVAVTPPTPAEPVSLDASGVSGNEIDLAWQDPTGYSAAYQIERSTDNGQTFSPLAIVNAPATTYADAALAPSTTYTYRVTAVNDTAASATTYPIMANSLSGFVTTNHPAPTTLGSSGSWQFSTPADEVVPDSEQPGNIFYVGQPIGFTLQEKGFTQPGNAKTYEVRDYYGNVVDSGSISQPLYLTLAAENPGWYKLYLYGAPANTTATFGDVVGSTTFCVFRNDPNFPDAAGLRADGHDFAPVFTRVDPAIDFTSTGAWSGGTPDATKIPGGPFAARWTGQLRPTQSGTYTLSISAYARLWLNGQEIIDVWTVAGGGGPNSCTIGLEGGKFYDIRIDFFNRNTTGAQMVFSWSSTSLGIGLQPVPGSVLYSGAGSLGSVGDGLTADYYGDLVSPGGNDQAVRAITGMGPQRYAADASNPTATIAQLQPQVTFDSQYYTPLDPQRHRGLLIAFPNGTEPYLSGVTQIVQQFQGQVQYWEPQNEPNYAYSGAAFVPIMRDFYNTVKAVNPNLKVIGPGVVTIGPYGLNWIHDFLAAGGGQYIDAFSFHAYNNVNRDLTLARESLNGLKSLLNQYGLGSIPLWQTEQGYMAAVYGAYEPANQGEWTMLEQMVFEQYGIPKEHNHLWYDVSNGFWDEPMFWENGDGSLNPAAPLMRVWSEELYGANFSQAYDFGPTGNNTYIGSLFTGSGKNVAVFMTGGATDGQVNLNVTGGSTLRVVDAFGNATTVPVVNGKATIAVPILPVYVELASGQSIGVIPLNWGIDLATQAGVTAYASGSAVHPVDPTVPNSINKIHDGVLQNWYYNQQPNDHVWAGNTPAGQQSWVEIDLPAATSVDHVIVRAPTPWQWDGAPLDYALQYYSNGQWVTIQHVREDPKTFGAYSPATDTTVDSYYSERSIFTHTFSPVVTAKIRLLVNDETWGGGATQLVQQAGGQTGPHQLTLQEIEIYGS